MEDIIEELESEYFTQENLKMKDLKQEKTKDEKKTKKKKKKEVKKMKKKKRRTRTKKFNIYLILVSAIWLILTFLNTFLVIKYDVLPLKFLIIFAGARANNSHSNC